MLYRVKAKFHDANLGLFFAGLNNGTIFNQLSAEDNQLLCIEHEHMPS